MFNSNQFFGGGAAGFYPVSIDQSLRFNDNDSAYLSRTPASAGNQKTWALSFWLKPCNQTINRTILARHDSGSNTFVFRLDQNDDLQIENYVSAYQLHLITNAKFRDSSAWYHIVLTIDTTQATPSDRARLYVNGEQVTSFSTSIYPSQNTDLKVNAASAHRIGTRSPDNYLDGYLAEVHFTDGTGYDADAFGELKSGVWVAKTPSVTYGTNGFHLDFANSADIGNDVSGEGNDWTPNNFTASDVVLDSPTDNFATFSPVVKPRNGTYFRPVCTLSDGNLVRTTTVDGSGSAIPFGADSGKYYIEFNITVLGQRQRIAVHSSEDFNMADGAVTTKSDGTGTATSDTSWTTGDVIAIAVDMDNNKVFFAKNNAWYGSSDPATNTGGDSLLSFTGFDVHQDSGSTNTSTISFNAGQLGFTYTPPTGYLALSTANLPDPVIDPAQGSSPEDYFGIDTYTGTGASHERSELQFQPDFVWIKNRTNAYNHYLYDAVRGASAQFYSNKTDAEVSTSTFTSFDSDGFTLSSNIGVNESGSNFVAWNWKANGSGVSNTDGSITSDVSANTTSGFSIVSWNTGSTAQDVTIGHGLDVAPELIINQNRSVGGNWWVYSAELGKNDYVILNATQGGGFTDLRIWADTAPTSTVFSTEIGYVFPASSHDIISYCFHSVEGFSKFGSYTGNGSADGTFVYTGFRPSMIMVKASSTTSHWYILDAVRNTYNEVDSFIKPNSSNADATSLPFDFTSNGFKIRTSSGGPNTSGATYIYMAFAEDGGPFKYSRAR